MEEQKAKRNSPKTSPVTQVFQGEEKNSSYQFPVLIWDSKQRWLRHSLFFPPPIWNSPERGFNFWRFEEWVNRVNSSNCYYKKTLNRTMWPRTSQHQLDDWTSSYWYPFHLGKFSSFMIVGERVPSRELTDPTLGKEIIFKSALVGDILVPRRVKSELQTRSPSRSQLGGSLWVQVVWFGPPKLVGHFFSRLILCRKNQHFMPHFQICGPNL